MCALQPQITFPSIVEICYRLFSRGGAVGAGRELPAHPLSAALTKRRAACDKDHRFPWMGGVKAG